jgi:hypothetical protein
MKPLLYNPQLFAYTAQRIMETQMSNVESPQHYTSGYIEVIYAIHDVLGREGFKAFCMGNYIKYNARANHKGLKAEDLAKADQYLEWATNGLPAPVDGRVPRQPERFGYLSPSMGWNALDTGEAIHEAVERAVQASPALGAGYGDAGQTFPNDGSQMGEAYKRLDSALEAYEARHAEAAIGDGSEGRGEAPKLDVRSGPTAKTVANAIGPAITAALGSEIMKSVRLRVTKNLNQCPEHGDSIYFVAEVYDREDNDQISSAMILSDEPDEVVCGMVGSVLAGDIQHYFS